LISHDDKEASMPPELAVGKRAEDAAELDATGADR
jgi:hypothetical protein